MQQKLVPTMADPHTDPSGPIHPQEPSWTIDGTYATSYQSNVAVSGAIADMWREWVVPNGLRPANVKIWNHNDEFLQMLNGAVLVEVEVWEDGGVHSPPIQTAVMPAGKESTAPPPQRHTLHTASGLHSAAPLSCRSRRLHFKWSHSPSEGVKLNHVGP